MRDRIVAIICNAIDVEPEQCTDEAKLMFDLGADSLDAISLTMDLEQEFYIEISDEDAEKLTTVGEVVAYIERATSHHRPLADATGAP